MNQELFNQVSFKLKELDETISALKKNDDNKVFVQKKVLLEYLALARKYCEIRLKEINDK